MTDKTVNGSPSSEIEQIKGVFSAPNDKTKDLATTDLPIENKVEHIPMIIGVPEHAGAGDVEPCL